MKAFRFRLEKVLHWRHTQLTIEQQKLKDSVQRLAAIQAEMAKLAEQRNFAEDQTRRASLVTGSDLKSLSVYEIHLQYKEREAAARQRECEQQILHQSERVREARRNQMLIEMLKAKRLAAWKYEADREQENLNAEVFLARWNRQE